MPPFDQVKIAVHFILNERNLSRVCSRSRRKLGGMAYHHHLNLQVIKCCHSGSNPEDPFPSVEFALPHKLSKEVHFCYFSNYILKRGFAEAGEIITAAQARHIISWRRGLKGEKTSPTLCGHKDLGFSCEAVAVCIFYGCSQQRGRKYPTVMSRRAHTHTHKPSGHRQKTSSLGSSKHRHIDWK